MATWCRIKNGKVAELVGRDPAVETPNSPYTWLSCADSVRSGWVYDEDKKTFTEPYEAEGTTNYAVVDVDHRVLEDEEKADKLSADNGMRITVRPAKETDSMESVADQNTGIL